MDIGSAVGRAEGVTEGQLMELARYRESDVFNEVERLVLDLATAMTERSVDVPPALHAELRHHLSRTQLVEMTAAIAWENYRARFNRANGVRPAGFSEGAVCVLPQPPR